MFLVKTLSLLYFLSVVCYSLHLLAPYVNGEIASASVSTSANLFNTEQIKDVLNCEGSTTPGAGSSCTITPKEFFFPSLVAIDDVIMALTGIDCDGDSKEDIDILTKYIESKNINNWLKEPSNIDNENGWKPQFAVKDAWKKGATSKLFFAAQKEKKIYILLINDSAQGVPEGSTLSWECKLFVTTPIESELSKTTIKWSEQKTLELQKTIFDKLKKKFQEDLRDITPAGVFVLLNKENNIVFVLQLTKNNNKKNTIFLFIQLEENSSTAKLASVESVSDGCSFNLFTWQSEIMMIKNCNDVRKMLQLNKDKESWEDSDDPVFRVLYNVKNKHYFITTTIGNNNKDVLLYTQQKNKPACSENKKSCIDLWMTDGDRSYNVGNIVTSDKEEVIFDSLLHTKDKLFSLHHEKEGAQETKSVIFTNLQEKFKKITDTLSGWEKSDEKIQTLCTDTTTLKIPCVTNGLVSYLSSFEDKKWKDEYGYNDITISNCEKVAEGIKCDGSDKGEKLFVGKTTTEGQPYNFIDSGFTFVAIVTLNSVEKDNYNSVLGVGLSTQEIFLGLWCSNDKKWVVGKGNDPKQLNPTTEDCELDKTYQVTFIFEKKVKSFAVYIDGHELGGLTPESIETLKTEDISYVYFGVNNKQNNVETNVTIKNVLLYNRPFNESEITKLKIEKQEITKDTKKRSSENSMAEQQSSSDNTEKSEDVMGGGSGGGDDLTSDTLTGEVVQTLTQQRESAVGNNVNSVNVGMLYLMFISFMALVVCL